MEDNLLELFSSSSALNQLNSLSTRLVVTFAAPLFLVGCGGQEYRTKSAETGRAHLFLNANEVTGRIEGVSGATISATGILSVSVRKLALMAEKEAPIVRTDTIKVTKANPVGMSLATLFTLGIYPVVAPGEAWASLVGKDEVANQREAPDYSRARSTGRYRWQGIRGNQSETIEVSLGQGAVELHSSVASYHERSGANFSIDLKKLIQQRLRASNDPEISISITCGCRWSGSQAGASTDDLKLRPTTVIKLTKADYPNLFPSPRPGQTPSKEKSPFRGFQPH